MSVIHENILVELPAKEKNPTVYIPEEEQDKKQVGKVVAYGEAVPTSVQKLLEKQPQIEYKEYYDGAEIIVHEKNCIVMNYKDILIIR